MKKTLTAIDLFCGMGGFSTGFINAGWHVVAAMDANIDALATYYANLCDEDTKLIGNFSRKDMELIECARKDWRLFDSRGYEAAAGPGYRKSSIYQENQEWIFRDMLPVGDEWIHGIPPAVNVLFYKKAQDITGYEILDAVSDITQDEQIGVVVGGPPCQGFSRANKNRHSRDTRNFLVFEFGRLVMEINPMTFVMENVPAIQNMKLPDGSNLVETFIEMVNKQDWDIYYEVQAMFMDGNTDPDGECTVIPWEQNPVQRMLCQ
jgi:DNA (cytosine-5)-methyltransferase 1